MKIKLSQMINPHFNSMWTTNKPYIIAKGGRGSFKSSVISLKLVMIMKSQTQQGHKVNTVCIRENSVNLRDSVYNQVIWALNMLKLLDEYELGVSPLKITHKTTGSAFYFYGADNPMKLKSNTIGDVLAVWYEECANMKSVDVFDQANPTFIRQKSKWVDTVKVYYSYNPPRNPFEWINGWIKDKEQDENYFIDTSTYLDDKLGFTTSQQLDLINAYKKNDYDYYCWLYLGEIVGLGNSVYNMNTLQDHAVKSLPTNEHVRLVCYSIDAGHETSATTCMQWAITNKNNVCLMDTFYYSPAGKAVKLAPVELSKQIHDFQLKSYQALPNKAPIEKFTIDSAEGALRNQYYYDWNVHLHPVAKEKKQAMISYTQSLLAAGRVYYVDNDNNQIWLDQMQMYRWDEKTTESDDPKVIKEDDHTCDAFQYFVKDNLQVLQLKY